MEVTSIDHLDTHAVIGGGKIQKFKAKIDARFYEQQSSTLYSDEKRACVREILCNAWDSHIESKIKNTPVSIKLTSDSLVIQDFGAGIPKDSMGNVYCTFGGTTKLDIAEATGGFGLGSKAPFSYAKNFSVTSCHGGWRTVYNISRGTTATEGIPDMRIMVDVPCGTETGITVTVPINPIDRDRFEYLIKSLVYLGGIKATLNGKPLRTIDYDQVEPGCPLVMIPLGRFPDYLSTKKTEGAAQFFVKTGSVVYPIPGEITEYLYLSFLDRDINTYTRMQYIFIAPPNSIGITPSRESIKLTNLTRETLKRLFEDAQKYIKSLEEPVVVTSTEFVKNSISTQLSDTNIKNARASAFLDENFSSISKIINEPRIGYKKLITDSFMTTKPSSVYITNNCIDRESYEKYLCSLALTYSLGIDRISEKFLEADPKGSKIKAVAEKCVKINYPIISRKIFSYIKKGYCFNKATKRATFEFGESLTKLMSRFYNMGNVEVFTHKGSQSSSMAEEPFLNWSRSFLTNSKIKRLSANSSRILDFIRLCNNSKKKNLNEVPVILAQSRAALKRLVKTDDVSFDYTNCIVVIAKKKSEYETIKNHIQNKLKLKTFHYTSDPLYLAKIKPMSNIHMVRVTDATDTVEFIPIQGHFVKHYIYNIYDYHTNRYGIKTIKSCLKMDDSYMLELSYLFGNIAIVTDMQEASYMESLGAKNVLSIVADEAKEWLTAPENKQTAFSKIVELGRYGSSFQMSKILSLSSIENILEAFDMEPVRKESLTEMPVLVNLFFELLAAKYPPKYGMQKIQKAAYDVSEIITKTFSPEMNYVFNDPDFRMFVNHLPNYHELKKGTKNLFEISMLAVMQTLRIRYGLKGMKND